MDLEWVSGPLIVVALVVALVVWLRRTLDPRLVIEDATGGPAEIAAYLPSLIAEELDLLREEGGGTNLRWAAGTDEPIELPDTVLAADRAKIVTWLIALLPRPTFVFQLKLIASGVGDRPGLVVNLRSGGHQRGSAVLWDADFGPAPVVPDLAPARAPSPPADEPDPADGALGAAAVEGGGPDDENEGGAKKKGPTEKPADAGGDGDGEPGPEPEGEPGGGSKLPAGATEAFHRLARAAAAWLAYRLPTNDPRGREHALLTSDWQSYAHFRIGAEDEQLARESFVRALRSDSRNRGALHNLAVLDVLQHCYGPALHRLAAAVALLGDEGRERDRLWYRARFNLAAAAVNYVLDRAAYPLRPECQPPAPEDDRAYIRVARDALTELITAANTAIAALERDQELTRQGIPSDSALLGFLRDIRAAGMITQTDVEALDDATP